MRRFTALSFRIYATGTVIMLVISTLALTTNINRTYVTGTIIMFVVSAKSAYFKHVCSKRKERLF
jgi:hypothetical protein